MQEAERIYHSTEILSRNIFDGVIENSEELGKLFRDKKYKKRARKTISDLELPQAQMLASELLWTVGQVDDVNRRDGALELLKMIPLKLLDRGELYDQYLELIDLQSGEVDVYGRIYSLLEAGKVLAPIFSHTQPVRQDIEDKWEKFVQSFKDEDRKVVEDGLEKILKILTPKKKPSAKGKVQINKK